MPKAWDLGRGIGFVWGLFFQNENLLKGLVKEGVIGTERDRSGYSVGQ